MMVQHWQWHRSRPTAHDPRGSNEFVLFHSCQAREASLPSPRVLVVKQSHLCNATQRNATCLCVHKTSQTSRGQRQEEKRSLSPVANQIVYRRRRHLEILLSIFQSSSSMGSKGEAEAPSWADQWGSGEDSGSSSNGKADKKKKTTVAANVKAAASEGLVKAKAAALVGAHKVKTGTTSGIKWVREQYNKRASNSK
ncbi:hypothetical protein BS78_01G167800 [Paspalum vaginatum]|nr:hypothetical protein BS78_01G167800 [Paspalum vaginatum]